VAVAGQPERELRGENVARSSRVLQGRHLSLERLHDLLAPERPNGLLSRGLMGS